MLPGCQKKRLKSKKKRNLFSNLFHWYTMRLTNTSLLSPLPQHKNLGTLFLELRHEVRLEAAQDLKLRQRFTLKQNNPKHTARATI